MARTISSVRIAEPNDNKDKLGPRILKVETRHGASFETPTKPITNRELFSRSNAPQIRGIMPGDMAIVPQYVLGKIFEKYQECNGTVNKIYDKVSQYSESVSFLYNVPTLQIEPIMPDKPIAVLTLARQADISSLSGVCMPLLDTDYEGFRRTLSQWSNYAEDHDKDCIPQIAMDEPLPLFRKKLALIEELSKAGEIKMVDFVYRDYNKYSLQFAEVWAKRSNIEAIMHCSAIPKDSGSLCNYMSKSSRYDLTILGFDTTSVKRNHPGYFPDTITPGGKEQITGYSWSNVLTETNINGNYWEVMEHESLYCDCPVCRRKSQDEIIERFAYNTEGDVEASSMNTISVLHDHYSSSKEMKAIRKAVLKGEIKDHADSVNDNRSRFQKEVKIGNIRNYPDGKKADEAEKDI